MTTPKLNALGNPSWDLYVGDTKDYSLDWSAWLESDTIDTSVWTVDAGATKVSDTNTTTTATLWVTGVTAGNKVRCVNTIVTAGGRTESQVVELVVRAT